MTSPGCRKPTILDGMMFIAATAAGLTLVRVGWSSFGWGTGPDRVSRLADGIRLASCLVLMWSLAFLPVRLRGPRPRFREVARQPGMIACCATCLSVLVGSIASIPSITAALSRPGISLVQNIAVTVMSNQNIAHSVLASWMALFLTGNWRPERGWIDRMGVALGVFWVLALASLASLALL